MSGRKSANVTISEDCYNEMLDNTRRADDARRAAERRIAEAREQNRAQRERFEQQQQDMQEEYRAGLDDLSSAIRDAEEEQNRRLDQVRVQAANDRRKAAEDLAALGRDVTHRIEAQGARFQHALDRQGAELRKTIDEQAATFERALGDHRREVKAALNKIEQDIQSDKARQRAIAVSQIEDIEKLFRLMRTQRDHERFAPGELDKIESKFSHCRTDLDSGNSPAAFANARERYFEYQELRQRVAERQAEWEAYLAEVQRLAEDTSGAMAATEGAKYTFSDDSSQQVEAQIDYWSEGKLEDFNNRLKDHLARLETPEELSTDDLKELMNALAPMEGELSGIVADAKERLVQSQMRQNIAASILDSFKGTPWQLDDSTYQHEDFRRGLHLKLKNASDEHIVASVMPVGNAQGGMRSNVEINFYDRLNDDRLRQARLKDMNDRLRQEGVEVGQFECQDGSQGRPGAEEMRDFARLRAPRPTAGTSV